MNVLFSSKEYDFHTIIKVAGIVGLASVVSFHQAGDDYLVTFPDCENPSKDSCGFSRAAAWAGKQHLKLLNGLF